MIVWKHREWWYSTRAPHAVNERIGFARRGGPLRRNLFRTLALPALVACLVSREDSPFASPAPSSASSDAVLLEESLQITIQSESEATMSFLNRTQILTEAGAEEYGHPAIDYRPSLEIRDIRASTTSPSGKRTEVKKQMISDDAAFQSFDLYSDSRQRTIHFPGVVPGSVLEYSYLQSVKSLFFLPDDFTFQNEIPARLKTLSVRYPASYPLKAVVRQGAPEPQREEKDGWITLRWEGRELSPLRRETGMPPFWDVVPSVRLFPGAMVWGGEPLNATTWEGIARWYWSLSKDRMTPAPAVKQFASEIATPGTDSLATVRKLYEFAQKKVHYVSVALGVGGWQPHSNEEIFLHRYGDCKDKATLLIAMLRSVGLNGFPVLIRTRDIGVMDKDLPSIAFNHAMVAIPQSGGLLFLDPTSESTPLGELPWQDQGALALVIHDDGSAEVTVTPLAPPDKNHRSRTVEGRLALNGDLEGTFTIDSWGSMRNRMQEFETNTSTSEKPELIQDLMGWLCPGANIRSHQMLPPRGPNDPFRIRVEFSVPRLVTRSGSLEILNPHVARFPFLGNLGSASSRLYPVFFDELFLEDAEVRIALPPGMTLKQVPKGSKVEGPGLTANFEYELKREESSQVLFLRQTLRVSQRELPASDFPALKQFAENLAREEASAVTMVPSD
jgi:uncharacterized protein DUF3857/transglutaminase superfamily protein